MKSLLSITLGILWLCTPTQAADKWDTLFNISQGAFVASNVADFYSGARLDDSRYYEANPIMGQSSYQQAIVMGSTSTFTFFAARRLYKKHKWLGFAFMVGGTVLHGWAAGHNFGLE